MTEPDTPSSYRSGFVSFVGRPNAGKSTLTNAMVGQKVVITSDKPQTTRTVVRGIVNRPDAQLILVDTPGLHRPRTLLGERLNDLVKTTLGRGRRGRRVLPGQREDRARRPVHRQRDGARYVAPSRSPSPPRPTWPRPSRSASTCSTSRRSASRDRAPSGPRSCRSRRCPADQVDLLADLLVGLLPEGPQLYPDGELTDAPEEILVAELIREAALDGVRDELPHSIAVVVEEMGLREGRPDDKPLLDIHANLYVERVLAEGHRHRPQGRPPPRRRHRAPGTRSRPCSAPRSTSTCTSRSPRTGSATRGSCASWASEAARLEPCVPRSSQQSAPSRSRSAGRPATAARSATRSPSGS